MVVYTNIKNLNNIRNLNSIIFLVTFSYLPDLSTMLMERMLTKKITTRLYIDL
jgi:hypothetical protein